MPDKFSLFTPDFLRAAVVRAIRTLAQTAVGLIGPDAVGVIDVDWTAIGSGAVLAALVSLLMSVATGIPEVD